MFHNILVNILVFSHLSKIQIFVQRLRKDYSMKICNSKIFRNKNTFPWYVFWIMVSRSVVISLHFNENLTISSFFLYFLKSCQNQRESVVSACLNIFFKSISKLLQFVTGFWSFLDVSGHFNKSAHFLIIRNRYNPFNRAASLAKC